MMEKCSVCGNNVNVGGEDVTHFDFPEIDLEVLEDCHMVLYVMNPYSTLCDKLGKLIEKLTKKKMGKKFDVSNVYKDQTINFMYEGEEYTWKGDYSVRQFGEESDRDYPGDCETEIAILETEYIETWSEKEANWIRVEPKSSMLIELEFEIERNL
jgi:hypothetical protein